MSKAEEEAVEGFSVELIHRDSPKSPFYDPSLTPAQRISNAARRSADRAKRLVKRPNAAEGNIVANGGEYLLEYWLGTPKVKILGIADTGSDLIWTQCTPCSECYNQTAPLFDPSKSTSFNQLPCGSDSCVAVQGTSCGDNSHCQYQARYGDGSFTNGDVATETLTLGSTTASPVALRNATIGCGHNNDGTFDERGSGIVGLGGGFASLITQLGPSIGGKFSYCLLPLSNTEESSKLNFGSNAVVSGSGAVSTPLVDGETDTFYFLTLEAVSVGNNRIEFSSAGQQVGGNIIIDSGTTLTLLPTDFYSRVEDAVVEAVSAAERIGSPVSGLSLCYAASSPAALQAPPLTVHFDGADVKLSANNTFVLASDNEVCFTFASSQNLAIYGNLAQMDFLVGYDRQAKTVSFKPTNCANQ
ncbi:hypothetical protein FEM48_Zijuj06G0201900 [Ziziphus jujuba var. spinosa]|uniref:Peptidase A1 domain-containing protein n=1 Tax=Ziziphus jujuba var. spinosa TaxID=714518 RepID=A0A978VBD4_ZIZJJ|nr:hypothetical protein FEM48_Zijuj06G0201900 [Ziziphus jujuba var. spinosa]